MDFSLGNFWYLFLLLLLPAIGMLIFGFKKWKLEKKFLFAESSFHNNLNFRTYPFSKILPYCYILAFLFLIFAMVDVLSGRQEVRMTQKTSAVIFVIDVSNSMNAQDVQPSRLELAKAIVMNAVQNIHDGKVGIIVFAGEAESIMPLTSDFSATETYLSSLETSVIGRQGTDFLKAIKVAAKKFKNIPKGNRKIILISDGEDNEGNDQAALEEAQKEGITINSVGIGNEEGAPIPVYELGQLMGYKTDLNDQTVITKRQTQALMSLAYDTDGEYIDGNKINNAIPQILNVIKKQKSGAEMVVNSQFEVHYYQWFLAVSFALFFLIYLANPKKDANL
jgi:Ca-activated chloride channel family protein